VPSQVKLNTSVLEAVAVIVGATPPGQMAPADVIEPTPVVLTKSLMFFPATGFKNEKVEAALSETI